MQQAALCMHGDWDTGTLRLDDTGYRLAAYAWETRGSGIKGGAGARGADSTQKELLHDPTGIVHTHRSQCCVVVAAGVLAVAGFVAFTLLMVY